MNAVSDFADLLRSTRGTASIEFAIIVGGLTIAVVAAAIVVAPALHAYADKLSAIAEHADTVLNRLSAQNTTGP